MRRRPGYSADWPELSRATLQRAGNRCKRCGAPNGALIAIGAREDEGTYLHGDVVRRVIDGKVVRSVTGGGMFTMSKHVKVQLHAAHLNGDIGDNRKRNLVALCRRCHLEHDKEQHRRSLKATNRRKFYERTRQLVLPEVGEG